MTQSARTTFGHKLLAAFTLTLAAAAIALVSPSMAAEKTEPAPYVDSRAIRERFDNITPADMEMLRGKKILLASRSFGLNLRKGLAALAKQNSMYEFLSSYERYDVFKAGGDLGIIPPDIYRHTKFVHFLATNWPHTKRVEEVGRLLRDKPHEFGKTVDAVIIILSTAEPESFQQYASMMDAMQRDFPNIRFIYVTAGFNAATRAQTNELCHEWSELARARYKGTAPLYDLGKILSDDFRAGHAFCPEYSRDPAGIHPNLDAGQIMMAKGFLLVLRDAFAWTPAAAPAGPETARKASSQADALPAGHPDYKAVRSILDANGLTEKKVEGVTVAEQGRVVKLYLQEGGIRELPDAVAALTELRVLHLYGDRNLPLPLLEKISPAIGRCAKLEELLLNSNELRSLPEEIVNLTKIRSLSLADNRLKNLPPSVADWVKRFDPKGLEQQKP